LQKKKEDIKIFIKYRIKLNRPMEKGKKEWSEKIKCEREKEKKNEWT
jgi:hypothetical protein